MLQSPIIAEPSSRAACNTPTPPHVGCPVTAAENPSKVAPPTPLSEKRNNEAGTKTAANCIPDLLSDITPDMIQAAAAEARRVIDAEAQGLSQLSSMINDSFARAAAALLAIPGRIIITGLGKSGHIGRKMASTMASTGSPAFFLHPGDFNHGELGAFNRGDAVIMLSRSGDVPELLQTIARCHRLEIPLISITAKPRSRLAQDSNVALLIPDIPEACPHGLAPTTSSTAMLALGDALAMYMMKKRRFTGDDFRLNHPGGNIGRRALSVREILMKNEKAKMAPTVFTSTLFSDAATVMLCGGLGMCGIIDDNGRLIDVLTDATIGAVMLEKLSMADDVASILETLKQRQPTRFVYSLEEISLTEDSQVATAVSKMNQRQLPGIFVVGEDGYSIGFLSLNQCLEAGISAAC